MLSHANYNVCMLGIFPLIYLGGAPSLSGGVSHNSLEQEVNLDSRHGDSCQR